MPFQYQPLAPSLHPPTQFWTVLRELWLPHNFILEYGLTDAKKFARASLRRRLRGKKMLIRRKNRRLRLKRKKKVVSANISPEENLHKCKSWLLSPKLKSPLSTCPRVSLCWMTLSTNCPMRKPSLYATYFWEHISHVTGLCVVLNIAHPALTQNFMSSNRITGCYTAAGKTERVPC